MAFIGNHVDPNAQPSVDFAPIPTGEYIAQIVDSDMKPTSKNDGQYLELVYRIIDGPLTGRLVWARLNLDNQNVKTVEIANQHLASIRVACGLQSVRDSAELHNIPHLIRVEHIPAGTVDKRGRTQQKDGNEIRGWKRVEGALPTAATQAAPQAAAPATAAGKPSWAQKPAA